MPRAGSLCELCFRTGLLSGMITMSELTGRLCIGVSRSCNGAAAVQPFQKAELTLSVGLTQEFMWMGCSQAYI